MKLNKKAFTLIEILIVIVIIGVLALTFIPTILTGPDDARDAVTDIHLTKGYESWGVFNENTYATGGTNNIHNNTKIPFALLFKPELEESGNAGMILTKYNSSSNREFMFYTWKYAGGTNVLYFWFTDGSSTDQVQLIPDLQKGLTYKVKGVFENGKITWSVNNGDEQIYTSTITNIVSSTSKTMVGARNNGTDGLFTGKIYYIKFGDIEYQFNDNFDSTTLVNTGENIENATITTTGSITDFWQKIPNDV